MKCSKEREDKARVWVLCIILGLLVLGYVSLWIYVTWLAAILTGVTVLAFSLAMIAGWLAGEINFCSENNYDPARQIRKSLKEKED